MTYKQKEAKKPSFVLNYEGQKVFFKEYGFDLPQIPITISKTRKVGGEYHTQGRIELASMSPEAIELTLVHEFVHVLQSKDRKSSTKPESKVLVSVLEEGGAEFITTIYSLSKDSRLGKGRYKDASTIISDFQGDISHSIKKIGKEISINSIDGWVNALYETLKESDNPYKAFYELIKDDYKKNPFNKYLIGSSFSFLVFSCNRFDVKETITDLIDVNPEHKLIDKISGIIKADKSGRILNSL